MIKLPSKAKLEKLTYDDWLEFFRKIPASELQDAEVSLKGEIPVEGYAALSRWLEIIENPSRMDKLYQGRLKAQAEADIMEVAVGESDEAVWEALIRRNAAQLDAGATSPQEVARLSQNLGIFRDRLHEVRARKPKKGSVLEKVLEAAAKPKKTTVKKAKTAKKPAAKPKTAAKSTKNAKKLAKTPAKASKTKKTVEQSKEKK